MEPLKHNNTNAHTDRHTHTIDYLTLGCKQENFLRN